MARVKQTARKSAGQKAPLIQLVKGLAKGNATPGEKKSPNEEEEQAESGSDDSVDTSLMNYVVAERKQKKATPRKQSAKKKATPRKQSAKKKATPRKAKVAPRKKKQSKDDSEDDSEEELVRESETKLSRKSLPAIARMPAKELVTAMVRNRANISSIFNPSAVPITITELDTYIERVQKLRIPARRRDFVLVKTAMLNYLHRRRDQLSARAGPGFRDETKVNNIRALERLRAIAGQSSDEYARRERAERKDFDDDLGDFFVDDMLFDNDDVQQFLDQEDPVSEEDEAFFKLVNWRLHEWLQSVFGFLPLAAVPLRARGTQNSCASSTLDEFKLLEAITMDNSRFAKQNFRRIIENSNNEGKEVPEPNEVHLRKAMLFYLAPMTNISPGSFTLMKNAVMAYFVQLLNTLKKFRKHDGNFTVCDASTNAGKISDNVQRHNFKANAETLDVYEIELAIASGDESEEIDANEEDESDTSDDDNEDLDGLSFGEEEDWW